MVRSAVTLEDKYREKSGRIYLSGLQALVRIPLIQRQLDNARNLNTAGFISGYRGSPIGALDMALERAQSYLDEYNIHFRPGVNEDLGATAVWGSQQLGLGPGAQYDGIIGMWYGKGPGLDRSTDAIKHANAAGTAKHGGVLALAGDDHACKSSTLPHQSEHGFIHCMVPTINPAGIQDTLDLGLHGIAMSRYSGCWTGFKIVTDMADSSASVFTDPFAIDFKTPEDFQMPEGGLNIRWYDQPVEQERRLLEYKLPAVQAYVRANKLDKTIFTAKKKKLGLISTGKAYMDLRQALQELGIDNEAAEALGISLYKIALVWPLEEQGLREFAAGHDEVLIVEEKRPVLENQIKQALFNIPAKQRPRIVGKKDENDLLMFPEYYELSPTLIADILLKRLRQFADTSTYDERLNVLVEHFKRKNSASEVTRMPYYCSGCPHNTSTVVPEGSRALAGIGCHYMAMWMDRSTYMFSQMGGEGVPWIGQAPFTKEKHVFVNLGDGTYFHSGLLAIRAAVAANVNITYKILYNDAVAMTGGQDVDGTLSVDRIARQVDAEGVKNIYLMSDEPEKYGNNANFPTGIHLNHRDDLDLIQREMRDLKGVSVLIYDQTCAAEKRRRRKRGLMEDPAKRAVINERICEGCGDCGEKSNCLSIIPIETEFGRKRQIDQSTCNKDFSCVKGFCPSFVTVHGGALKKPEAVASNDDAENQIFKDLPSPKLPNLDNPRAILVTGVGGTGIVTIGALLAMAAHLEDKGCTTMDQTGLAQKGGAVTSHIHIAKKPEDIHTVRIGAGLADVVIGCDLLVTADGDTRSTIHNNETRVFLNTHETPTGAFTHNTDWTIPSSNLVDTISQICGEDNIDILDATKIATKLMGNSIATNMFMLGYAWQNGTIPVSQEAIMRAIELNKVAIPMNQKSFMWGRLAAHDLETVLETIKPNEDENLGTAHRHISENVAELIARRFDSLRAYQNNSYAQKFKDLVLRIQDVEKTLPNTGDEKLTQAVTKYLYKLMAYKDEYEVARLYSDGEFLDFIKARYEGNYKLRFNLAPPLFANRDPVTQQLRKKEYGPWMLKAFSLLAKMKFCRGTPFDVFGYTKERRHERRLIKEYCAMLDLILEKINADNYHAAIEAVQYPEHIRGFGHVKEANILKSDEEKETLIENFLNPQPPEEKQIEDTETVKDQEEAA